MSRNRTFVSARGSIDTFDPAAERTSDLPPAGPADGCDGSPWCTCWDCVRVNGPAALDLEDW